MLSTPRLLLREFRASDWEAVLEYQSDPRYLRYTPWDRRTAAEVREFVAGFLAQQAEQPRRSWQFAIVEPSTLRLIGNCGVRLDAIGAHSGSIGYEIDPRAWGQGYATEAAQELLRFGFEQLRLERIWAWTIAANVASGRVLEKLGMRLEARLSQHEQFKGRSWDVLRFGLSAGDWQQGRESAGARTSPPLPPE